MRELLREKIDYRVAHNVINVPSHDALAGFANRLFLLFSFIGQHSLHRNLAFSAYAASSDAQQQSVGLSVLC